MYIPGKRFAAETKRVNITPLKASKLSKLPYRALSAARGRDRSPLTARFPNNGEKKGCLTLFRAAVPFGGQITYNLSGLSPKRDCGSKGVKSRTFFFSERHLTTKKKKKKNFWFGIIGKPSRRSTIEYHMYSLVKQKRKTKKFLSQHDVLAGRQLNFFI